MSVRQWSSWPHAFGRRSGALVDESECPHAEVPQVGSVSDTNHAAALAGRGAVVRSSDLGLLPSFRKMCVGGRKSG